MNMIIKNLRAFFYTIAITITFILLQQGMLEAGIGVSPNVLEVIVKPGEVYKGYFVVNNSGKDPVGVKITPEKWINKGVDFDKWLKIEKSEFILDASKREKVDYEITVPKDTEGELMCMVFFVSRPKGEKASIVGIRFGVPMYVVVEGTGNLDVDIEKLSVEYNISSNIIKGKITIDNKSNVHIRPKVKLMILNEAGEMVTVVKTSGKQPAQREQKRSFPFNAKRKLKPGKYKVVAEVDCGKLYSIDKIVKGETELIVEEAQKVETEATDKVKVEDKK